MSDSSSSGDGASQVDSDVDSDTSKNRWAMAVLVGAAVVTTIVNVVMIWVGATKEQAVTSTQVEELRKRVANVESQNDEEVKHLGYVDSRYERRRDFEGVRDDAAEFKSDFKDLVEVESRIRALEKLQGRLVTLEKDVGVGAAQSKSMGESVGNPGLFTARSPRLAHRG